MKVVNGERRKSQFTGTICLIISLTNPIANQLATFQWFQPNRCELWRQYSISTAHTKAIKSVFIYNILFLNYKLQLFFDIFIVLSKNLFEHRRTDSTEAAPSNSKSSSFKNLLITMWEWFLKKITILNIL